MFVKIAHSTFLKYWMHNIFIIYVFIGVDTSAIQEIQQK